MANPTKCVADYRDKVGRDPKAVAATTKRFEESDMAADMRRFQAGEMTEGEFMSRWVTNPAR